MLENSEETREETREKTLTALFTPSTDAKKASAGRGTAIIATIGAVDADREIIMDGALMNPGQKVPVMSQHGYTDSIPFGMAKAREEDGHIVMDFELFTTTEAGQRFYESVKARGEGQEWSVGITVKEQAFVTQEDRHIRELRKIRLNEVSAVVRGAQPGTRTVTMKESSRNDERLSELEKQVKDLTSKLTAVEIALREREEPDPQKTADPAETEEPETTQVPVTPDPTDSFILPEDLRESLASLNGGTP